VYNFNLLNEHSVPCIWLAWDKLHTRAVFLWHKIGLRNT